VSRDAGAGDGEGASRRSEMAASAAAAGGEILAALRGEILPPKDLENFRGGEGVFIDYY